MASPVYERENCRGDKSSCLHCCCDKSLSLSLSLRYVAPIQTSLNFFSTDRSDNDFHMSREATCRGDLSHRVSRPLWELQAPGNGLKGALKNRLEHY